MSTDAYRQSNQMAAMDREGWIEWYRVELDRIQRLANRSSQEVRDTLEWSIPFMKSVIAGEVEPVLPPPMVPRATRVMHERPVISAQRKILGVVKAA